MEDNGIERRREQNLVYNFLRVVEMAAIAAARTMGRGERKYSDQVAVETMRAEMDLIPMQGRIVIGEGERDEAPMLYIGEHVGIGINDKNPTIPYPEVDIAVDPLEGTNLCATGAPNAIAVLAAAERGGLIHAPDVYMQKLVVGPAAKGAVDIDAPVKDNLRAIAKRLNRDVEDLVIVVMDRPRHRQLVADIKAAGARIRLITDGDLSAGISAAVGGSGVHAVMGIGGGPEGVITAAAMKCLNGEIQGRFLTKEMMEQPEDRAKIADDIVERMKVMGINDPGRVHDTNELAPGKKIIFAACGVTDGMLRGVRFFGAGTRTESLLMTTDTHHVRFVDTLHLEGDPDAVVRFDRF